MSEVYGGDHTCSDCGRSIPPLNQPCPYCEWFQGNKEDALEKLTTLLDKEEGGDQ